MRGVTCTLMVWGVLVAASTASAQLTQSFDPSEVELPPPDDANVDDDTVIRWAAREVARIDGRRVPERTPAPPAPYRTSAAPTLPALTLTDPLTRVFAEAGFGALGALVGLGAVTLTLWLTDEVGAAPADRAIGLGVSAAVAGLLVAGGVTLGGELRAGRGNFGHAFIGMLLGAVAAIPLIVYGLAFMVEGAAIAAGSVLPLVGAVLGYEIGHAGGAPRSRPLGAS